MNKKWYKLLITCVTAGCVSVFAQQNIEATYRYPHLQNRCEQTSNWKPAKVIFYYKNNWSSDIYYEYDCKGSIIKYIEQGNDSIVACFDKKQAWRKRYNYSAIVDSILYYKKSSDEFELYKRVYDKNYDYDSLFWLSTTKIWDGAEWTEQSTIYEAYYDTSWFTIHSENTFNGKINFGYKNSVETDERGNIVKVVSEDYNTMKGKYEYYSTNEYFYDEKDVCYKKYLYLFKNNDWKLSRKSEYEWKEWRGFDDGSILWLGRTYTDATNNRLRWEKSWNWNGQKEEWIMAGMYDWDWNIDENGSFVARFFQTNEGELFLNLVDTIYFDEYGNIKKEIQREFWIPDENGSQEEVFFWQKIVESEYGDKGRYRWHSFLSSIHHETGDTIYWDYLYVVDSFVDITTLSLDESVLQEKINSIVVIPNPATGDITIRAEETLQKIEIFDISGKAVFGREAIGEKETICSLGMLPKGIYLIRAQLKNGKIATEKVVLQ